MYRIDLPQCRPKGIRQYVYLHAKGLAAAIKMATPINEHRNGKKPLRIIDTKNKTIVWLNGRKTQKQFDATGVHASHCCLIHGCKYGDKDCPVVLELESQLYPCESCDYNGITSQNLKDVLTGQIERCEHCGHIL